MTLEVEAFLETRLFWRRPHFDLPTTYLVTVEASQSDSELVACGIVLQGSDSTSDTFFALVDSVEQEYRVLKREGEDTPDALISSTFDSAIREGGGNQLELLVDGEKLAFAVNGESLAEVTDAGLTTVGRVGLAGSFGIDGVQNCTFDDLSVTESEGIDSAALGAGGALALDPADLGAGWEVSDRDQSQTRDRAWPIHCGGTEASGTVRIDRVEFQDYTNDGDIRKAFVLVAETEPDLVDALFASERANLAFCDAGGGFLRRVETTTPPELGSDSLAGRSLTGDSDDAQFTMIKVSPTTVLYTLLYSPSEAMDPLDGNRFAEVVYAALF